MVPVCGREFETRANLLEACTNLYTARTCKSGLDLATFAVTAGVSSPARWPPRFAPSGCRASPTSASPIWSTSSATGSARSRSRCSSSTRPAARWRPRRCSAAMHFAPALLGPPLVARVEALPVRARAAACSTRPRPSLRVLALLVDDFALVAVLALATLDGSLASAARALTRAAAAAALAPAGQLREGNALLNVAFTVGAAGGPAIAGLVVAGAGVETALLADAASFLAVAALLAVARACGCPRPSEPEAPAGRGACAAAWLRARARRAAAPARRPGARLRLLLARDPDRGRVREGDPRRRRRRLRRPAGELGRRHGRRQPRLRRPAPGPAPRALLASPPSRSASPTSAPRSPRRSRSPARPRSSAGSATGSSGSRS